MSAMVEVNELDYEIAKEIAHQIQTDQKRKVSCRYRTPRNPRVVCSKLQQNS